MKLTGLRMPLTVLHRTTPALSILLNAPRFSLRTVSMTGGLRHKSIRLFQAGCIDC